MQECRNAEMQPAALNPRAAAPVHCCILAFLHFRAAEGE